MIREDIILGYTKDRDVLDIGSVGQSKEYSLWKLMKDNCRSLVGIDVTSSGNEDIVRGDMQTYRFDRQFDLVVAGDVLEHVENQGQFLRNVHRHLRDRGLAVITTPNAKWPTVFLRPNATHALWHDIHTLERILHVTGFEIVLQRYYYGNKLHYSLPVRLLVYRQGILVVCRKA